MPAPPASRILSARTPTPERSDPCASLILSAALAALAAGPGLAELPDLGGREVTVVTENAYPPLQFVDPKTGEAIGWEYDAMNEIAQAAELQARSSRTRAGTR